MTTTVENPPLFCTFRSADHWFGVPVEDVKEITTQTTCTRIPHAPREVAGYVNIRGHIFMALDPRALGPRGDGDRGESPDRLQAGSRPVIRPPRRGDW